MKPHIGYRITIELHVGPRGKMIELVGETPDYRPGNGVTDADVCAIAANALIWQADAMATAASSHANMARISRALNLPLNQVPF